MTRPGRPYPLRLYTGLFPVVFCFFFSPFTPLKAQPSVEIVVTLDRAAACDSFYIAGNFNGWNPADSRFRIYASGNSSRIRLNHLPAGRLEWKFTRGGWNRVETAADGSDIPNRFLQTVADTVVSCRVAAWKQDDPSGTRHTASTRVQLMDSAFFFPSLNNYRPVWLYLPPGYSQSKKRYPVLYMHDGQNLFNEATAAIAEWGVDETIDSLVSRGGPAAIVVGIAHGGIHRMQEYNAWPFTWAGEEGPVMIEPAADRYLHDLVHQLKPYIDQHYRTRPGPEYTITAGSSMGGLVACYAALKYPDVFGIAGVFSPAFWTAEGFGTFADSAAVKQQGKFFFYIGGREGDQHIRNMNQVHQLLGKRSASMIYCVEDPAGEHNEWYWRKWFPEFFRWALADGFNVITAD